MCPWSAEVNGGMSKGLNAPYLVALRSDRYESCPNALDLATDLQLVQPGGVKHVLQNIDAAVRLQHRSTKTSNQDSSPQPAQAHAGRGILDARPEGVHLVVEAAIRPVRPRVCHLHRWLHSYQVLT